MNIRNNILDYLYDKEYIVAMYDDSLYVFNFNALKEFSSERIIVEISNRTITLSGSNLTITKITKEELLIKGSITSIGVEYKR